MTALLTVIAILVLLGLVLYGLGALLLGGEGRRIVERCTRGMGDLTPGDEEVLFTKRRRGRSAARPYH